MSRREARGIPVASEWSMTSAREIVVEYLRAIESHDLDRVGEFLHADVRVVEHPNKLNPNGATYDRAAIRAAGERGKALLASERYEVRALTVEGDRVVAQIAWTGTLRDGRSLHAQICSVVELRDGLVWRQEQYDCFA
jgi:ketosteroid isomerase-like protein